MAKMDAYVPFTGPLIMSYGKRYRDEREELVKQIDMLLEWDTGLAQPCHCEFHDPKECAEDRANDELQRDGLALSIKNALMLND